MTKEIEKAIEDAFENTIARKRELIEEEKMDIEDSEEQIKELESDIKELEDEKQELRSAIEKGAEDPLHIFKLNPRDSINLSEEDCKKANEWTLGHALRFHTQEALGLASPRYKGAIGHSDYMIRMGWTSIGRYVELVCTECEKLAAKQKAEGKKRLEYSDYTYDIEAIG